VLVLIVKIKKNGFNLLGMPFLEGLDEEKSLTLSEACVFLAFS
jgi:hypothetical protein